MLPGGAECSASPLMNTFYTLLTLVKGTLSNMQNNVIKQLCIIIKLITHAFLKIQVHNDFNIW